MIVLRLASNEGQLKLYSLCFVAIRFFYLRQFLLVPMHAAVHGLRFNAVWNVYFLA